MVQTRKFHRLRIELENGMLIVAIVSRGFPLEFFRGLTLAWVQVVFRIYEILNAQVRPMPMPTIPRALHRPKPEAPH